MGQSNTSSARVRAAERRLRAFELRRSGMSYQAIGDAIGVSGPAAHKMVTKYLAQIASDTRNEAEEVRKMELERIDRLQAGVWASATTGDPAAILSFCRLHDRRASILGLNAPHKLAHTNPDGSEERPGTGVLVVTEKAEGVQEWLQQIGFTKPAEQPDDPDSDSET